MVNLKFLLGFSAFFFGGMFVLDIFQDFIFLPALFALVLFIIVFVSELKDKKDEDK